MSVEELHNKWLHNFTKETFPIYIYIGDSKKLNGKSVMFILNEK